MRLLIQCAMIFCGTLFAAAQLALGEPQGRTPAVEGNAAPVAGAMASPGARPWHQHTAAAQPGR